MQLTCPECKNNVDLTARKELKPEQVVECNTCGITLMVNKVEGDSVEAEVVDEGK
jgi:ribosomal protein S27E